MDRRKRIGIYGGTFDPVHYGHLEVAKIVSQIFDIDELLFVPAQNAPHKLTRAVSLPIHRYAMLVLATQAERRLLVSTFEIEAPDRRYTVDTVAHFRSQLGDSAELFFIMGADSWTEITTWREWERLLGMANHIVVTRPGYDANNADVIPNLSARVVDLSGCKQESIDEIVNEAQGHQIYVTDAVRVDISATEIRLAAREERIDDLFRFVPAPVAEYIRKYGIYRESHEA